MRTFYVYMLRCIDGTFYVGITNDIDRRFAEHESGQKPTSYTYSRRPLRLVYAGEFDNPSDAIAFEKKLKGWTHAKKRAFADRNWPTLKALATPRVTPPVTPSNVEGQRKSSTLDTEREGARCLRVRR